MGDIGKLRTIDFKQTKDFVCDGKRFHLQETLSFVRYRELQKIILEFGYSATFQDIFKNLRIAWDHLNALRLGEAAIIIHNIMAGIITLDDKDDPALRMCALFIDQEGEDPARYDEAQMKAKIECWSKELDVLPFFRLAASLTPGWMPAYKIVSRGGSRKEKVSEESVT